MALSPINHIAHHILFISRQRQLDTENRSSLKVSKDTAKDVKISDAVETVASSDDSLRLKEDQYHQIKRQLHIPKKMCCDLIVWTLDDLAIIPIAKDANWAINSETLTHFYFIIRASGI